MHGTDWSSYHRYYHANLSDSQMKDCDPIRELEDKIF